MNAFASTERIFGAALNGGATTSNFDINLYYILRLISLFLLLQNLENKYNLEGFKRERKSERNARVRVTT
jgi:hypothetical protein